MAEEIVVSVPTSPAAATPIRQVRSTLLCGSFKALKDVGLDAEYLSHLDKKHHDAILYSPMGVWLPVELAEAHYDAADCLGLPPARIASIVAPLHEVATRTGLGAALSLANAAGATPWTIYANFGRFWGRFFDGGGATIYRMGPKDARLEGTGVPFARSQYFRVGMRCLVQGVTRLFCTTAMVKELPSRTPGTISYHSAWA